MDGVVGIAGPRDGADPQAWADLLLDADRRQYKVRLQGIDAPEKGQDYWRVSRQSLADRVFSQSVIIEYEKTDRYGRLVGRVLRDGRDINFEMLQGGAAWFYAKYARELPADRQLNYASAEALAREARQGLWRDPYLNRPGFSRHQPASE